MNAIPRGQRYINYLVPFSKTPQPILHHLYNICNLLSYIHSPLNNHPDDTPLHSIDQVPPNFNVYGVSGGITNRLFVVKYAQYPAILIRLFANHTDEVIERSAEARIAVSVSNECLSSAILGFFVNGRLEGFIEKDDMTTEYLNTAIKPEFDPHKPVGTPSLTPDMMIDDYYSLCIAEQVGKLHSSSISATEAHNINLNRLQEFDTVADSTRNKHEYLSYSSNNSNASTTPPLSPQSRTEPTNDEKQIPKAILWPTIMKWLQLSLEKYDLFQDSPERYESYNSLNISRMFREVTELKSILDLFDDTVVFAHNDLLSGNILILPRGFDWQLYRYSYGLPFHHHSDDSLTHHLPPDIRHSEFDSKNNHSNITVPDITDTLSFNSSNGGEEYIYNPPRDNVADSELPSKVLLIDYEYSGLNYASYDIANHFNECCGFQCDWDKYPSYEKQRQFLRQYMISNHNISPENDINGYIDSPLFNSRLEILRRRVLGFTLASHLYWGIWAIVMASSKPDIDFDYLSYAKLRLDGYWYMKNSCLLAAIPLVWSKLHQNTWVNTPLIANAVLSQEQRRREMFHNTISIVGTGHSFKLALGTISASHGVYVNNVIMRCREGESAESYQARSAVISGLVDTYNSYYNYEIGIHIDIDHLHFFLDSESSPTTNDVSDEKKGDVAPVYCSCAAVVHHVDAAHVPIYPAQPSHAEKNQKMLEIVDKEIASYLSTIIPGVLSTGQILVPSQFFYPTTPKFPLIIDDTTILVENNSNISFDRAHSTPVVQPNTHITEIYRHVLKAMVETDKANAIPISPDMKAKYDTLLSTQYTSFSYDQQAFTRALEMAIVTHPAYTLQYLDTHPTAFKRIPHTSAQIHKSQLTYHATLSQPDTLTTPSAVTFLATPPSEHYLEALFALITLKQHVIIDKPFTPTLEQTQHLFRIAYHHKLLLSAFQNRRFDSDFLTTKYITYSASSATSFLNYDNLLGDKINWFELSFQKGLSCSKTWKLTPNAKGGGRLFDLGAHCIDQLIQLVTSSSADVPMNGGLVLPQTIQSTLRYDFDEHNEMDTHGLITIKFNNDKHGIVDVGSYTMFEKPRFNIVSDIATCTQPHISLLCSPEHREKDQNASATSQTKRSMVDLMKNSGDQQEPTLLKHLPIETTVELFTQSQYIKYRPLEQIPSYFKNRQLLLQKYQERIKNSKRGDDNSKSLINKLNTLVLPLFPGRWPKFFELFNRYQQQFELHTLATNSSAIEIQTNLSTEDLFDAGKCKHLPLPPVSTTLYAPHAHSIVTNAYYTSLTTDISPATIADSESSSGALSIANIVLKEFNLPVNPFDTLLLSAIFDTILLSHKTQMPQQLIKFHPCQE